MPKAIRAVMVVCVALLSLPISGQQKPAPQRSTRTIRYPYSLTAFTGDVPPHFQGNDLKAIAAVLASRFAERGEYETTAQYNLRIQKASSAVISDGIPNDSRLAFVFPTDEALRTDWEAKSAIDPVYDADKEAFDVSIRVTPTVRGLDLNAPEGLSMIWSKDSESSDKHSATNGFGAVASVTESTSTHHALSFAASSIFLGRSASGTDVPISLVARVDAARAQSVKPQLRVLVICTIAASSPTSEADAFHSASLEAPIESQDTYKYLHVVPSEFWIFNSATGEVFGKTTRFQIARKLAKSFAAGGDVAR